MQKNLKNSCIVLLIIVYLFSFFFSSPAMVDLKQSFEYIETSQQENTEKSQISSEQTNDVYTAPLNTNKKPEIDRSETKKTFDIEKSYSQKIQKYNVAKTAETAVKNRVAIKTLFPEILSSQEILLSFGDWYVIEATDETIDYYCRLSAVMDIAQVNEVTISEIESFNYGYELINTEEGKSDLVNKYGNTSNMPEIPVAVIDTGIDNSHELFEGRILPHNKNTTYRFLDDNKASSDNEDDNGHGTHVAGIIALSTLDNVKIRSYKVADKEGKSTDVAIVAAIYAAIKDQVKVINISMSIDAISVNSNLYEEAFYSAYKAGITICVAAGNKAINCDISPLTNSNYTICVASIDLSKQRSAFSNFGSCVDFCAPGENINSAQMGGGYVEFSGTSMATPFISAACATVLSYDAKMNLTDVKRTLKNTALDLGTSGWDEYYGYGMIYLDNISLLESIDVPKISPTNRYSKSKIKVTIEANDPEAEIYYTINGKNPSLKSTKYNGPFYISKSTVIKAISYKEGAGESEIAKKKYYFDGSYIAEDFIIDEDGNLKQYTGLDRQLTIPKKINGVTLKTLNRTVFSNSVLKKIIIPDTVELIECQALPSNLEYLYIGANVKYIDIFNTNTFANMEIEVSPKNQNFKIIDNGLYELKNGKPYALIKYMFNYNVKTHRIPDTVEIVYHDAFSSCVIDREFIDTTNIYVGKNVSNLFFYHDGAFLGYHYLPVKFYIHPENQSYTSLSDAIFSKDKKIMYHYPSYKKNSEYTVPNGVEILYEGLFYYTQLNTVRLPESLREIRYGSLILFDSEKITIPKGVQFISMGAVGNSDSTASVYFDGDSPSFVHNDAFYAKYLYKYEKARGFGSPSQYTNIQAIKNRTDGTYSANIRYPVNGGMIYFDPYNCTIVGYEGNIKNLSIPKEIEGRKVKNIGAFAFEKNNTLETLTFLGEIDNIHISAFNSCETLKSVEFKESVSIIGESAFRDCVKLEKVSFGEGVRCIGNLAFYDCVMLHEINLPFGLENIGHGAFAFCSNLTIDEFPSSLKTIASAAFTVVQFKDDFVRIPSNVLIYDHIFEATNKTILIPNTVQHIAYESFTNHDSASPQNLNVYFEGDYKESYSPFAFDGTNTITLYFNKSAKGYERINSKKVKIKFIDNMSDYFEGHTHSFEEYIYNNDGYYGFDGTEFANCTKPCCNASSTRMAEHNYTAKVLEGDANLKEFADGVKLYYNVCERCGKFDSGVFSMNDSNVISCDHDFNEWQTKKDATCKNTGYKLRECQTCGLKNFEITMLNPENHIGERVLKNHKSATCISEGYSGDTYCIDCESILDHGDVIQKTGKHTFSDWVTIKEPTCVEKGDKYRKCIYCNFQEKKTINTFQGNHGKKVAKNYIAPTCGKGGNKESTYCSDCDHLLIKGEAIQNTGKHIFKYTSIQLGSFSKKAKYNAKCKVCKNRYREITSSRLKTIKLSDDSFTYNGKSIKPKITVFNEKGNIISPEFYTVSYNNNKNIGTATATVRFHTVYDCTKTVNFEITPKTILATLYGYNDVKVSWNKNSKADAYKVYYKKASSKSYKYKGTTSKTYMKLKNLSNCTKYKLKVVPCVKTNDKYVAIDKTRVTSISTTKNLSAPKTVKAALYGADDVKVSWSKVSGAAAYKVYYKAGSGSYKLKTTTTSLSYKFKNLSDGVKYSFKVIPCTKVNGVYYADASYKTASTYTLKKISTPTVKKYKSGKVKVSWKNISGESGYQISQFTRKSKTKIVSTYKTTSGKSKVISAKKGKTYYYKVRAYKTVNGKKIYGSWSSVKKYKLK